MTGALQPALLHFSMLLLGTCFNYFVCAPHCLMLARLVVQVLRLVQLVRAELTRCHRILPDCDCSVRGTIVAAEPQCVHTYMCTFCNERRYSAYDWYDFYDWYSWYDWYRYAASWLAGYQSKLLVYHRSICVMIAGYVFRFAFCGSGAQLVQWSHVHLLWCEHQVYPRICRLLLLLLVRSGCRW